MTEQKFLARFVFYQILGDEIKPFPSYYIKRSEIPELPSGSHVSAESFVKHNLPIPRTPSFEEWKLRIEKKLKCRYCYKTMRRPADLKWHLEYVHKIKHPIIFNDGYKLERKELT